MKMDQNRPSWLEFGYRRNATNVEPPWEDQAQFRRNVEDDSASFTLPSLIFLECGFQTKIILSCVYGNNLMMGKGREAPLPSNYSFGFQS